MLLSLCFMEFSVDVRVLKHKRVRSLPLCVTHVPVGIIVSSSFSWLVGCFED